MRDRTASGERRDGPALAGSPGRAGKADRTKSPWQERGDMSPGDERGQTSVDFAISMGVLLVAVVTAVAFLPQITGPFVDLPGENPLIADRTADQLVETQLAANDTAGTLDPVCTLYFFNDTSPINPCPTFSSASGTTVNDKLGLDDDVHVRVTVEQNVSGSAEPEILCGRGLLGDGKVVDPPCGGGEFPLAIGDEPANHKSVADARRMVLLDGRQNVFVRVRVWK